MRILLLFITIHPLVVFAQTDSAGTKEQTIDFTAEIFNGKEHPGYLSGINGTAYYLDDDWQPGGVTYRDVYYSSMWLKYDLVQKELIVRHPANKVAITLFTPRIASFSVSGKNFIHINQNDTTGMAPGIYEEVKTGKLNFYILRSKYLLETPTQNGLERQFLSNDSYYIIKDHRCYHLKKKKSIWALIDGKKSAIKADLRKKDLSYRRDREASLTEIITFYNEATN